MLYQFISLFLVSRGLQELIPLNYDKHIMSNITLRAYHSLGCIYYLTPLLLKMEKPLNEIETSRAPSDIEFVLKRSAQFFIWDIYSLSLSNEKNKMLYTLHHLISSGTIMYSLHYGINWYFVSLGLFLGEITNPITQVCAICEVLNYYNISFERFYFMCMLFVRGVIGPCLTLIMTYQIGNLCSIHGKEVLYNKSIILNYITLISITLGSIDWLNGKYKEITFSGIKDK